MHNQFKYRLPILALMFIIMTSQYALTQKMIVDPTSTPPDTVKNLKKAEQIGYINTWTAEIGSSDPGGLAYHPNKKCLILTDSEINEYNFFNRGDNLYNVFLLSYADQQCLEKYQIGNLNKSKRIDAEPTGIVYNIIDGYYYVTNDDRGSLTQYDSTFQPTGFSIDLKAMGCNDAEGLTFNPDKNEYYICSGSSGGSAEIFIFNQEFKLTNKFSVQSRIKDPEGLSYDPVSKTLFMVCGGRVNLILQYSIEGQYLAEYSIGHLQPTPHLIDAMAIVPNYESQNIHVFLGDRGLDNNNVPPGQYSEDGRIYEVILEK